MIPAIHVIMAIHPTLVLLPILGFLVLPCKSIDSDNGLRVVNVTTVNPGDCDTPLCHPPECTKAIYDGNKSLCYLISCPENHCDNLTLIKELLAKQESFNVETDLLHHSSGNNSSVPFQDGSSSNGGQQLTPTANNSSISSPTNPPASLDRSTTTASTKPQTTPSKQANGSEEITGVIPTITTPPTNTSPPTTTTTPSNTSTPTTTTTPSNTSTPTTTTTTATTTKPSTTSTSTSVTTTVAQTTIPQQPSSPSPSGAETSASISPSVPTTPPSIPSSKPVQPSPVATSRKPSPTTAKTSTHPSVVPSTTPKDNGDQSRTDQAKVEVGGDPLTIHLLNTSSLLAVLMFGLLFFVVTVALFLKQGYESYRRKDYTQVDYLINGMYTDSGV